MELSGEEVHKALLEAFPRRNVRSWGVIDGQSVTIRATCRRCGDNGEFRTREEVNNFKRLHENEQGICPFAKEVKY